MAARRYLFWFFGIAGAIVLAIVAFNIAADAYIPNSRAGASVETVSGFERVLKPAWLDTVKPSIVFVGSSRVRMAFDPALIDPTFRVKSFDYGVSSATAYETRRYMRDAAAQPSVKTIVVSLDPFEDGSSSQPIGAGFDELRLAVTKTGAQTPHRDWWLMTSRYLSGGALGMHALGVYLLARLGQNQSASDRPDIFEAYSRMTPAVLRHEMDRRNSRTIAPRAWQMNELRASLSALCNYRGAVYWFFPPDNFAVIARYVANDADGFIAFKKTVLAAVQDHNAKCENRVRLFDFMNLNAITRERLTASHTQSTFYEDPIHVRPPTGVMLLRLMLTPDRANANLGIELTGDPHADADIDSIRAQAAVWARN